MHAGSLYTHIKGAHEGLKYYCNDCDYKATHRGTLTTYIKAVHEGLIPNDCEYKATTRSSFFQHIKAVHEELKLWLLQIKSYMNGISP